MEHFAPTDEGAVTPSLQAVRDCNIFVILMGYRYGAIGDPASGRSVTEMEFDEAKNNGKVILAYTPIAEEEVSSEEMLARYFPNAFAHENDEEKRASMARQSQFLEKVRGDHLTPGSVSAYVTASYRNPELLQSQVVRDIEQGMQGRIPGEIAFRQSLVALRDKNFDVATYHLSRAVFYQQTLASQPVVDAATPGVHQSLSNPRDEHATPKYTPPFLLALSVLRNRAPGSILSEDIVGIEDNLKRSLKALPTVVAFFVWAYVKQDHYLDRGIMRPHQQEFDAIIKQVVKLNELPQSRAEGELGDLLRMFFPELVRKLDVLLTNPKTSSLYAPFRRLPGIIDAAKQ
jgi:hypothetical protein